MPFVAEDCDGRRFPVAPADPGVWTPIPVTAYRRCAWMGVLERHLVRVRGFGREYWADVFYARDARRFALAPPRGVAVVSGMAVKRRCGCQRAGA